MFYANEIANNLLCSTHPVSSRLPGKLLVFLTLEQSGLKVPQNIDDFKLSENTNNLSEKKQTKNSAVVHTPGKNFREEAKFMELNTA